MRLILTWWKTTVLPGFLCKRPIHCHEHQWGVTGVEEGGRGCVTTEHVEVSRRNKMAAGWDLLFPARASAGGGRSHS